MKAGRTRSVTNIPLIWRLRLVLHGVRLSPAAHDDLTTPRGARAVAYRVTMTDALLIGADTAPLESRVNLRAASFVLRRFGLQAAELWIDADGALVALDPGRSAAVPAGATTATFAKSRGVEYTVGHERRRESRTRTASPAS
jgi:hypothetical protein